MLNNNQLESLEPLVASISTFRFLSMVMDNYAVHDKDIESLKNKIPGDKLEIAKQCHQRLKRIAEIVAYD